MASELVTTIINAIMAFVSGMGNAFLEAFEGIFLTVSESGEVALNNLGIFILVFFGISLGYGVIRWITGLFRREAN